MATIEKRLARQVHRLEKAKARLKEATARGDRKEVRAATDGVRSHTRQILALERRQGRNQLVGKGARKTDGVDFYKSQAWRALRYKVLASSDRRCECCGASPRDGVVLHVDHIKPRSTHPALELDPSNMQVLCDACNLGKSNTDDTDFRL